MKHSISIPFFRFMLLILFINVVIDLFAQQTTIGPDVTFHFQPEGKVFGDPIPFFHDSVHHLFYLEQYTLPDGKLGGHSWAHLASRDLVTWKQLPLAIIPDESEPYIATGSIVEKNGIFYAFYSTAYGEERDPSISVATSSDLIHWTKSPHNPLIRLYHDVPGDIYETKMVWRDPHVFWNPEEKIWWMAIAALEQTNGDYVPSGAVAYATSIDLMDWHVQRKPMLLDRDCLAGECPDIIPFGDGWAMIYYPDMTRIRLADSPHGPWRRPKNDAPSGLHFNAGKTEFDGNRYIWHAYLARLSHDYDKHKYGGVMALPRELYMDASGNPAVRLVPEIVDACNKDATGGLGGKVFTPLLKSPVFSTSNTLILDPGAGDNALALWKDAPENFFLAADIEMQEEGQLTLYFRSTQNVDDSYILRIDARNSEVSFQRWTGWNRMSPMNARSLEIPKDRSFKLYVMLNGDVFEAFIDDKIAIGTRIQLPKGSLAVSARDSKVEMKNLRLTHLK
jgi:beta-fructofuranosidase